MFVEGSYKTAAIEGFSLGKLVFNLPAIPVVTVLDL